MLANGFFFFSPNDFSPKLAYSKVLQATVYYAHKYIHIKHNLYPNYYFFTRFHE